MLRPALALALLLGLLLAPAGGAFSSTPGGPHDDITRDGAGRAGFPKGGIDALVEAVRAPDLKDSKPKIGSDGVQFSATEHYEPFHHCDRVPPATHEDAFNATVAYVAREAEAARNASLAGDAEGAMEALGRALHALEDCFSHSNAIDLPEPTTVMHALVGNGPPPPGIRITSVLKDGDNPEKPPGDDYSHADYAKDSADKNDESKVVMADNRTKFEAARDLATDAVALFLQDWMGGLNPADVADLGEVSGPEGSLLPRWAPGPSALAPALAAAAAAGLLLRRR